MSWRHHAEEGLQLEPPAQTAPRLSELQRDRAADAGLMRPSALVVVRDRSQPTSAELKTRSQMPTTPRYGLRERFQMLRSKRFARRPCEKSAAAQVRSGETEG